MRVKSDQKVRTAIDSRNRDRRHCLLVAITRARDGQQSASLLEVSL